jgi:hypothetical protein
MIQQHFRVVRCSPLVLEQTIEDFISRGWLVQAVTDQVGIKHTVFFVKNPPMPAKLDAITEKAQEFYDRASKALDERERSGAHRRRQG